MNSDTTRYVLRLGGHGYRFMTRSEAEPLFADLDRFCEVIVEFGAVTGVGQGFVEQIFRVWAPGTTGLRRTGE
ncbi:MAG: DUF4325 domain-containing protein [Planctomycetota bacterium]